MTAFRAYAAAILAALPEAARGVSILAGGALRAYYDGTPVKDCDLFFRSHEDACIAESALRDGAGWRFVSSQGRAVTYRSPCGKDFNLVPFAFGDPVDHVGRFDFRCCQFAAWMEQGKVRVLRANQARVDCRKKRLKVVNNNGTERTAKRIEHYENDYGYTLVGIKLTRNARPARIRRYVARRPVSGYGHNS